MTSKSIKLLTAASLVAGAALATQPAHAVSFTNCTGAKIRLHIYNNDDVVKAIARSGGVIDINRERGFNPSNGRIAIKVFQTGIFDNLKMSQSGLEGSKYYSIRQDPNGRWLVSNLRSCY